MYILKIGVRQNKTAGYDKISISIKEAVMHSE